MHFPSLPALLLLLCATVTQTSPTFAADLTLNNHNHNISEAAQLVEERQIAAGGGAAPAATQAALQYPTTSVAGSLFTVGGTTSATWKLFTQTFAATALGGWPLGPTPAAGTIGLGSIAGAVGKTVSKRAAVQTPAPAAPVS